MRRTHACARGLSSLPKNENRIMVSPADVERLLTSMRHVSCFETQHIDVGKILRSMRHVSCFGEDLPEPAEEAFYQSFISRESLTESMEESGCEEESGCDEQTSGDYSDMQGDSSWGTEREDENEVEVEDEISSEKSGSSSHRGEEASSEDAVEHDESSNNIGSPEGKYECSVCGALHLKPSLLKQHMCTHSDDRLFMCPVGNCGRQYKRRDHLHRHSLTHKGNLFVCAWEGCDLAFNVHSNLQRHLKLHEKWGANLLGGSKSPDACLSCPEPWCRKTFRYPSLLQSHIENVHDALSVAQAVCMEPGCGEVFDNPQLLNIHTRAAHRFVYCGTCGVSMLRRNLAAHARQHEGGRELIRCPLPGCLHSYSKRSNLDTHIRAIHMDSKPYACSHAGCEMRFAYRSVRDKHELSSAHDMPDLEGDFETEDSEFQLQSRRGGRKRLRLHHVDDLLARKCHSQPDLE